MEVLDEVERLRGIGELVGKLVLLSLVPSHTALTNTPLAANPSEEHCRLILQFISDVGSATPRAIRQRLKLSRSTTFRLLRRLVVSGQVVRSGHTRDLCYRLPAQREAA